MSSAYLDLLPLSRDKREQLAALGAPTPEALLSMMRAVPADFERLLGREVAREVAADLEALIDEQDWQALQHVPLPQSPLGARLDKTPPLRGLDFGVRERDHLFALYQRLQKEAPTTRRARLEMERVEHQLNALLEPLPDVPSPGSSPVAWLLPYLARAPFRVAPERAAQLHGLMQKYGLFIQVQQHGTPRVALAGRLPRGFPAEKRSDSPHVIFDLDTAARWWAFAVTYRDLVRWGVQAGQGQVVHTQPCPEFLVRRVQEITSPGPASLDRWGIPAPTPSDPAEQAEPSAERLFLAMGACALLHDLGHVCQFHEQRLPRHAVEQEYQADAWSAEWLLGDWRAYGAGSEPRVFVLRVFGVLFALSCLAQNVPVPPAPPLGARRPEEGPRSNHPERLLRFLNQLDRFTTAEVQGEEAFAWRAACWLVTLHRRAAGRVVPNAQRSDDPRAFLEAAAEDGAGR